MICHDCASTWPSYRGVSQHVPNGIVLALTLHTIAFAGLTGASCSCSFFASPFFLLLLLLLELVLLVLLELLLPLFLLLLLLLLELLLASLPASLPVSLPVSPL